MSMMILMALNSKMAAVTLMTKIENIVSWDPQNKVDDMTKLVKIVLMTKVESIDHNVSWDTHIKVDDD